MSCQAIKKGDAIRCKLRAKAGEDLCRCHRESKENTGPNKWAREQMKLSQKSEMLRFMAEEDVAVRAEEDPRNKQLVIHTYEINHAILITRHQLQYRNLLADQAAEIARTGIDPDARIEERRRRRAEMQQGLIIARQIELERRHNGGVNHERIHNMAPNNIVRPAQERRLVDFANDPQNVHTSEMVEQTKKIIECVRKIPVPEGYAWDRIVASKTPFEIGLECKLSQKAAWQMISQYAQDVAIYDIEAGIYGKVLDSVWQFIKNAPEKVELCNVLRQEMEDNIGMCAQGNLSRVCNILSGYLEGVGSVESLSERLGRLFPPLLEVENLEERITRAVEILRENSAPRDQWESWLESLVSEGHELQEYAAIMGF